VTLAKEALAYTLVMQPNRVALALLLGAACSQAPPRPSALLVTIDTIRPDALSIHGAPSGLTPTLEALAEESVVFDEARTVAPITLPSHASMLTGLYPLRHGVRDNAWAPLPGEARTLAEIAHDAGYRTAAFVGSVVLKGDWGLAQGFDVYDEPIQDGVQADAHYVRRDARAVVDAALAWLDGHDPSRPFLCWVHFFDPHAPYAPPAEFARRAGGNPYRGEAAFVDAELGRLVAALKERGAWDDLTVVVVGDHGEALGEHGEATHASYCYDSTLKIPLLVRTPDGAGAGTRSDANVSAVDVLPTIARALNLPVPEGLDGRPLTEPVPDGRGVYAESYYGFLQFGWSPLAAWIEDEAKYLHSPTPELYDLSSDPGELANAATARAAELEDYRDEIAALAARPRLDAVRDEAGGRAEELASLGYAAAGSSEESLPEPLEPSDRPSPLESRWEQEALDRASQLVFEGRHAEAAQVYESIRRRHRANPTALGELAICLMRTNALDRAETVLRELLALGAGRALDHLNLAVCRQQKGDLEGTVEHLERALELNPHHAQGRAHLVSVLKSQGRHAEAARVAAAAPE